MQNIFQAGRALLAEGISRRPREMLVDKVRELTHSSDWSEQFIGL